ncbi:MAG: aminotransferase class I/II-fold pyridoxal phosphate-dependent enzyme [Gammaproteobacteria bacterium]|nr:aminotransferase class I/II-fold pyridoxal phosphate-dependent enzyme [Gammaproteobacteria bacterium]
MAINSNKDDKKLQAFSKIETLPSYIKLHRALAMLHRVGADDIYFMVTKGISTNKIIIEDKEYINYCGYNYIGMSGDPRVTKATIKAVEEYGSSVSASRIVSGEKPLHRELELTIAKLLGVENSLVFSAGHATNVSVITSIVGPDDLVIHDALIHNSLWQGTLFSRAKHVLFPHNDYEALERILKKKRNDYERVLILTEGVFSMDGDISDVPKLIALKKKYFAFLMVDEAHSMGVIGKHGLGIREYFDINPADVDIWMGTLSKSFGSCGGYIAGTHNLIRYLKYTCGGFMFSAGMSPANAAAALEAIHLLEDEPQRIERLQQRSQQLLSTLKQIGANTLTSENTPIIPVMVRTELNAIRLSHELFKRGILAAPIFFPGVKKGTARVRFFVTCLHTEEEIKYTCEVIKEILSTLKV